MELLDHESFILIFMRNYHTIFSGGGTILLSHQQCTKVHFFPTSSSTFAIFLFFAFFKKIFYLFIWKSEREHNWGCGRVRRREREADSPLSTALLEAQSQDPEIMTWAEARHLTEWATQTALILVFMCNMCFLKAAYRSPLLFRKSDNVYLLGCLDYVHWYNFFFFFALV